MRFRTTKPRRKGIPFIPIDEVREANAKLRRIAENKKKARR